MGDEKRSETDPEEGDLELEKETIGDLDVPGAEADDVKGGKPAGRDSLQLCPPPPKTGW